jgi:hypothetical protein
VVAVGGAVVLAAAQVGGNVGAAVLGSIVAVTVLLEVSS